MGSDIFWGKSESGRAHTFALCPEKGDDNGGADRAETLRVRVVTDCDGEITAMLSLAEEDVDPCSNWAGGCALRFEVRDGLTLDGILLVVQGEDYLGDVIEPPDWGILGEEGVPGEEVEVQEGTGLHGNDVIHITVYTGEACRSVGGGAALWPVARRLPHRPVRGGLHRPERLPRQ